MADGLQKAAIAPRMLVPAMCSGSYVVKEGIQTLSGATASAESIVSLKPHLRAEQTK
jgi:hypothetical protein